MNTFFTQSAKQRLLSLSTFLIMSMGYNNAQAQCTYFKTVNASASAVHCLGIKNDGTLWAWGSNQYGQLGDGSIGNTYPEPEQIGTKNNWNVIATGDGHSLAIDADGKLWAWGNDGDGQLGDGQPEGGALSVLTPKHITSADSIWKTVSASSSHSVGITADGRLWAWGYATYLSSAGTIPNIPTQVGTDSDWIAVSAGHLHTIAIKKDSTLWGWGRNGEGEAGDSTTTDNDYAPPVEIDSNHAWVFISAGYDHTLALKKDGSLWAWGQNNEGELGDGTKINGTHGPKQIGTKKWISIGAGLDFSDGIDADSLRWAWGYDGIGQFGNDSDNASQDRLTPELIDSSKNWITTYAAYSFSLSLTADQEVWSSGNNDQEELGDGTNIRKYSLIKAGTPAVYPALATSGSSDVEYQRGFSYYAVNCSDVITEVFKSGSNPIHANTTSKVWIDASVKTNGSEKPYVQRHYEIFPSNKDSLATGSVTLYFTQAEFNAYNAFAKVVDGTYPMLPVDSIDGSSLRDNLRVNEVNGISSDGSGALNTYKGTSTFIIPTSVIYMNGTWQATFNTTGFGGFFATTAAALLPVSWLSVNGTLNSYNQAVIKWKVNEMNVKNYAVEKSFDGISFNSIATITSKGNGVNMYQYADNLKITGSLFYRIKQTDKDGKVNYSKVIPLKNNSGNIALSLFPNPAVDVINVQTNMPGSVSVVVSDLSGRILIVSQVQPGTASLTLNISTLAKGVYQLKITNGTSTTVTKFIKE